MFNYWNRTIKFNIHSANPPGVKEIAEILQQSKPETEVTFLPAKKMWELAQNAQYYPANHPDGYKFETPDGKPFYCWCDCHGWGTTCRVTSGCCAYEKSQRTPGANENGP